MRIFVSVFVILGLLFATPVLAAWQYKTDTDPFSDETMAVVVGGDADVQLGAKCWKGDLEKTTIMIALPVPFDQAADYKPAVAVKMRVDSGETRDLLFTPTDLGGQLGFITTAEIHDDLIDIIRSWATAEKRVALSVESMNRIVSARGSSRAIQNFAKACGFPEP